LFFLQQPPLGLVDMRDLTSDSGSQAIVSTIIVTAHDLDLEVITAESSF
jgi:EAL domain-containing protein (putative c-di-GMP-specific phosphodiesterase class I)